MEQIEKEIQELIKKIDSIETDQERENFVTTNLTRFIEEGQEDLLLKFCKNIIIKEDNKSRHYPALLRMKCLYQLVNVTRENIIKLTDEKGKEDEVEELYIDLYEYMWYFKWILPKIPNHSNISIEGIDSANELMQFYYSKLGLNMAMYYKTIMLQNIIMGDTKNADKNYQMWQELVNKEDAGYDYITDCPACEATEKVNYYNFIGSHEKAIQEAEKILNGELICGEVPHITYGVVLKSYLALGMKAEAEKLLPIAVELIEENIDLVENITTLIEVAIELGKEDYAKELAVKYEDLILDKSEDFLAMKYYIATSVLWESHYKKALNFTQIFDERNGNAYHKNYLNDYFDKK